MEERLDVDLIKRCMVELKGFITDAGREDGDGFKPFDDVAKTGVYVELLRHAGMVEISGVGNNFPDVVSQKGLDFLTYLVDPPTWSPIRNKHKLGEFDFTVDTLYEELKKQYKLIHPG
jgi:hypothetical protein